MGVSTELASLVYQRLKEDILHLRMPQGTRIRELALAQRYAVSRSPIRQALRQLLDEGLVERRGRGYEVVSLGASDMRDLYEVREAIEKASVRLCAQRADETAIEHMRRIVDEQAKAVATGDLIRVSALDSAFHLAIATASGNAFMCRQLTVVHDRVRLMRTQEKPPAGWQTHVVMEHRRILSAVERRDAAVAEAEMRHHIQSVVRLHLGLAQERHEQST